MSLIGRLVGLALRALVLLLIVSLAWPHVAPHYTRLLLAAAGPLVPQGIALSDAGHSILIQYSSEAVDRGLGVDAFTLHSGLILGVVLVAATPRLRLLSRAVWVLVALGVFLLFHVVGVWLLASGFSWAVTKSIPWVRTGDVLAAFAIFWGLLPAIIGGAWCFKFWLPALRGEPETRRARDRE